MQKTVNWVRSRLLGVANWNLRTARGERGSREGLAKRKAVFPCHASIDPAAERFDLLLRERLAFGRHPLGGVSGRNPSDQRTLATLAGLDDATALATGQQRLPSVDRQSSFALRPGMTFRTTLAEKRLHVVSEVNVRRRTDRKLGPGDQTANGNQQVSHRQLF